QISGVTTNDFTRPVMYTVIAEDGSTKDYTVTVAVTVPGFGPPKGFSCLGAVFPASLAIADLDGNGKPDLALTCMVEYAEVAIALNETATNATEPSFSVEFPASYGGATSIATGDLTGDGTPDLAVAYPSVNKVVLLDPLRDIF